ncbi:MAG: EAL domain-containing protein, partial [Chloroflexota bacterium]|nr:EAL domain-containing protein [Chloroflexota bacterium]
DFRFVRQDDGSPAWGSLSVNPLLDETGQLSGVLVMVANISARKRAEDALAHQALHDSLTGLPNRVLLSDRLQQAVLNARREQRQVAVMFLDIDGFKDVNDSFGHDQGDQLLCLVGPRLAAVLRESDTVARLGADEFAVLVQGVNGEEEAALIAGKMLKALERPFTIGNRLIEISASVGIALCPTHGEDAASLLRRADTAMYRAKHHRDGYALYASSHDETSSDRLTLTAELRQAIEQDGLELFYQPKVRTKSRRLIGVEALARWPHPTKGYVSPSTFIPVAEKTGLVRPLTDWVLKTALQQLRVWHRGGLRMSVAVNLSMRDLRDPQLVEKLTRLLSEYGVDPTWLKLEITETMIMADPDQTMAVVTRLEEMGLSFCIDDFGTGYSSLSYLRQLPASEIKIDKSFVMDLLTDEHDATIVRSVIDLAHNLGRHTVAEGVETQEICAALGSLGCDAVQGYHIGRPMPIGAFNSWIEGWPAKPVALPVGHDVTE